MFPYMFPIVLQHAGVYPSFRHSPSLFVSWLYIFIYPIINPWLVVEPPLWKIWVRQMGFLFPIWGESHQIPWFQTTNQLYSPIINHYQPPLTMINQDYPIYKMENQPYYPLLTIYSPSYPLLTIYSNKPAPLHRHRRHPMSACDPVAWQKSAACPQSRAEWSWWPPEASELWKANRDILWETWEMFHKTMRGKLIIPSGNLT